MVYERKVEISSAKLQRLKIKKPFRIKLCKNKMKCASPENSQESFKTNFKDFNNMLMLNLHKTFEVNLILINDLI